MRMRNPTGKIGIIVNVIALTMALFAIYTAAYGSLEAMLQRSIHLTFSLMLVFILYPISKKVEKITIIDIVLSILSILPGLYIYLDYGRISTRWPFSDTVTNLDIFFGVIIIILLIEAARRLMGLVMSIIITIFLAYGLLGQYLPDKIAHGGYALNRIVEYLYLTTDGIFGIPLGASATFVVLFIILGSFLEICGSGKYFMDLAISLTGKSRGGPAKIGVISSALFGTISGASVANVYATGTFTIPLMKRVGYKPQFAAAVEAAASTGGQIMPPIMGSAAFIMADILGIPYIDIMIAAIIPAILYFLSIYIMIDFEAIKNQLPGLPESAIPLTKDVFKKSYLLMPPIIIIVFLVFRFTSNLAALMGIISAVIVGVINYKLKMNFLKIARALIEGAKRAILVAVATGAAGIIVGIASKTGLGLKFTSIVTNISGGHLWLAGILIMIASIILGMGLPTVAAYIMVAALTAPALIELGVTPIAAQMFVFYFCVISTITPPVALSAYAAASIANTDPFKTGFSAVRLGLVAFIVPFMFLYSDVLLLKGSVINIIVAFGSALVGVYALGSALQGWLFNKINLLERSIMLLIAFLTIIPDWKTDLIGLTLMISLILLNRKRNL